MIALLLWNPYISAGATGFQQKSHSVMMWMNLCTIKVSEYKYRSNDRSTLNVLQSNNKSTFLKEYDTTLHNSSWRRLSTNNHWLGEKGISQKSWTRCYHHRASKLRWPSQGGCSALGQQNKFKFGLIRQEKLFLLGWGCFDSNQDFIWLWSFGGVSKLWLSWE